MNLPDSNPDVEQTLRLAIAEHRLVSFTLDGRPRIAEPHDLGIIDGEPRLFFFQVGGASRSGRPFGWRWAFLSKMIDLQLQEQRFVGSRPAPSGRHQRWDRLLASVSVPPTP